MVYLLNRIFSLASISCVMLSRSCLLYTSLLIRKLAEASAIRAVQADSIARLVAGYKGGGIIVCGDFNDSPDVYKRQRLLRILHPAIEGRLRNCLFLRSCLVGLYYWTLFLSSL